MSSMNSAQSDGTDAIFWYGLSVLVLGGGAGVWLPLIMGKVVGADGLATYIFAILIPLLAEAVVIEPYWKRLSTATKTKLLFFSVLAAFLAVVALIRDGKSGDISAGITGAVISLIIWFVMTKSSGRFKPPQGKKSQAGSLGGTVVSPENLQGGGLAK